MLLEHKSKGTIHSLIMIPRMPTFAVSGALLELAGTLNSGASFYGTEHLGILQAIPPLDAGMSPIPTCDLSPYVLKVVNAICPRNKSLSTG